MLQLIIFKIPTKLFYFQICIQQNFRSLNKTLFCVDTLAKLFFPYKNVKTREYYWFGKL